MDSSPNTYQQSSFLIPGLLLILLFLTSTNFMVFLKQQCHWTQKLPLISRVISCPSPAVPELDIEFLEEEGCFDFDVQAFQAYETNEALGDVTPHIEFRVNRALSVHTDATEATHRIVVKRTVTPTYQLRTHNLHSTDREIKIGCENGRYHVRMNRTE
ncbi:MAG: hypothetical protein RhofKO_14700 [Rhodothermales bacterium]